MRKITLTFCIALLLFFVSGTEYIALAGSPTSPGTGSTNIQPVTLSNPLGGDTTPQVLIGRIINAVLGLVGSLALVMFIYGGMIWMTAAGASEKVQKGKDILIWATIGMIVIFSSYAITKFVLEAINSTT